MREAGQGQEGGYESEISLKNKHGQEIANQEEKREKTTPRRAATKEKKKMKRRRICSVD